MRGLKFGARHVARRFGSDGGRFRFAQRGMGALDRDGERSVFSRMQHRQFALDRRDFGAHAGDAFAVLAPGVFRLVALGGEVGKGGGQFGEDLLGRRPFAVGARSLSSRPPRAGRRSLAHLPGCSLPRRAGPPSPPRRLRRAVFRAQLGGELDHSQVEFGDALLGPLFFAIEVLRATFRRCRPAPAVPRPRAVPAARLRQRLAGGGFGLAPVRSATSRMPRPWCARPQRPRSLAEVQRRWCSVASVLRTCAERRDSGSPGAPGFFSASICAASWPITSSIREQIGFCGASAATRPRGGARAGRQRRRLPPARGGAARAWPG